MDGVDHIGWRTGNALLIDACLRAVAIETIVTVIISDARWPGNAVFQ